MREQDDREQFAAGLDQLLTGIRPSRST